MGHARLGAPSPTCRLQASSRRSGCVPAKPYPPMEHAKGISPRLGDKRAKQKSAFDRTSAFANYKLSAFADYSRPLLLAPRQDDPKSSPKRIAAKKAWERPPPRLSFSARLLRNHALSVKKHHNLLIGRHLPNPAFYSAVFQNALAGVR